MTNPAIAISAKIVGRSLEVSPRRSISVIVISEPIARANEAGRQSTPSRAATNPKRAAAGQPASSAQKPTRPKVQRVGEACKCSQTHDPPEDTEPAEDAVRQGGSAGVGRGHRTIPQGRGSR